MNHLCNKIAMNSSAMKSRRTGARCFYFDFFCVSSEAEWL